MCPKQDVPMRVLSALSAWQVLRPCGISDTTLNHKQDV